MNNPLSRSHLVTRRNGRSGEDRGFASAWSISRHTWLDDAQRHTPTCPSPFLCMVRDYIIVFLILDVLTPPHSQSNWIIVGSQAKNYLGLRYWCLRAQKKWKFSHMGKRSYLLTSAGWSANHGQIGWQWLAGNSPISRVRGFSFFVFLNLWATNWTFE